MKTRWYHLPVRKMVLVNKEKERLRCSGRGVLMVLPGVAAGMKNRVKKVRSASCPREG
ncbi:MAG: hypothetical protein VX699_08590 [Myxococcota bacterium]|nr:hypothetical protein [Myxococcota bacterium]